MYDAFIRSLNENDSIKNFNKLNCAVRLVQVNNYIFQYSFTEYKLFWLFSSSLCKVGNFTISLPLISFLSLNFIGLLVRFDGRNYHRSVQYRTNNQPAIH